MANGQNGGVAVDDSEVIDVEAVEIVSDSVAIGAVDRAQIDMQIATAKRYPRNIQKCIRDAIALACLDEETATSMHYAVPRYDKGKKVYISGESVRFAEIIAYTWGNLRFDKKVASIDDSYVTGQSTVFDLERNNAGRAEVKRRISYSDKGERKGKRYGEDMIQTTGMASASLAFRNAVLFVIPPAVVKKVSQAAKQMATGGAQPIEARRQKALKWFANVGAEEARVLRLLEVEKVDDITQEHLELLNGIKSAILDHQTTIEEAFDNPGEAQAADETKRRLADLQQRMGATTVDAPPPAEPKREADGTPTNLKMSLQLLRASFKKNKWVEDSYAVKQWLVTLVNKHAVSDLTTAEVTTVLKAIENGSKPESD